LPITETLQDSLLQIEEWVKERKINNFYYYTPWLLAQAEDPEVTYDMDYDTWGVTVDYKGQKRYYYIPFEDPYHPKVKEIVFDYPGRDLGEGWVKHKVDVNYINDPKEIVAHRGEDFHEFRHALNVCEKSLANKIVKYERSEKTREVYLFMKPLCDSKEELWTIRKLLDLKLGDYFHQDLEMKVLRVDGEIWSVNIWGKLWKGVIVYLVNKNKPGVPFLSDYSRFQFYEDIKDECEEVNDGSDLGVDGLRRFKRKFNPIRVEDIHSLVRNT